MSNPLKSRMNVSGGVNRRRAIATLASALVWVAGCNDHSDRPARPGVGLFTASQDIGDPELPGQLTSPEPGTYVVAGAGHNIWGARDAFHFAYTEITGDAELGAEIDLGAPLGQHYRKAVLMFRTSTAPDAAYVDVALHENGLASLQYRPYSGAPTLNLQSSLERPRRARLVRRGAYFHAEFESASGKHDVVGPIAVSLPESTLVGVGANSADPNQLARVTFRNVELGRAVSLATIEW